MTHYDPIATLQSESAQIAALYRILQLGSPALLGANASERIELPQTIYQILKDVVGNMRQGKSVVLIPEDAQLTTQMAANLLGVSRPHFIKLLDSGVVPYTKTGTHRRIRMIDIQAFARARDAERKAILNRMAQESLDDGSYVGIPIREGGEDE